MSVKIKMIDEILQLFYPGVSTQEIPGKKVAS